MRGMLQTDLPEQLRSSYIADVCLGRGSFGIAIKARMKQWTQEKSAPEFSLVGYKGQRVIKMVQNGGYKLGGDQLRRLDPSSAIAVPCLLCALCVKKSQHNGTLRAGCIARQSC
jgi:hypothetical protein